MDVYREIAAILHPLPGKDPEVPDEALEAARDEVLEAREKTAQLLELAVDGALETDWQGGWEDPGLGTDPLLAAIADARARKAQAEEEIRRLVAFGREFTRPRPYTLESLGGAAGMSVSGVRTSYDHDHVDAVAAAIGRKPRDWRAQDPTDPPDPKAATP